MKPSRLAEKLESRLWLLNASGSGRVTATVAKMSLVTILVKCKALWECLGLKNSTLAPVNVSLIDTSKTAFESKEAYAMVALGNDNYTNVIAEISTLETQNNYSE